jgi:hypothetical protein
MEKGVENLPFKQHHSIYSDGQPHLIFNVRINRPISNLQSKADIDKIGSGVKLHTTIYDDPSKDLERCKSSFLGFLLEDDDQYSITSMILENRPTFVFHTKTTRIAMMSYDPPVVREDEVGFLSEVDPIDKKESYGHLTFIKYGSSLYEQGYNAFQLDYNLKIAITNAISHGCGVNMRGLVDDSYQWWRFYRVGRSIHYSRSAVVPIQNWPGPPKQEKLSSFCDMSRLEIVISFPEKKADLLKIKDIHDYLLPLDLHQSRILLDAGYRARFYQNGLFVEQKRISEFYYGYNCKDIVEALNQEKSSVLLGFLLTPDIERYQEYYALENIEESACQNLAAEFKIRFPTIIPCYSDYFCDSYYHGTVKVKRCNKTLYSLLIKSKQYSSENDYVAVNLKRVEGTPAIQCNHPIIAYARDICDVTIRVSSGFLNLRYIWEPSKRIFWMNPPSPSIDEFNLYYTVLHDWFSVFRDLNPLSGLMIYNALTPPKAIPIELPPPELAPEGFHWETCAIPDKRRKL